MVAHNDVSGILPRALFICLAAAAMAVAPLPVEAQSPPPVRVPYMRVLSAPGLQVVASDQTSGKIALSVRQDRKRARPPAVSIRAILGTREDLLALLLNQSQPDDTCVLIQQARVYPATLTRNTLSIQGTVRTNWLARDDDSKRFLNTPYVLVIEEGAVTSENSEALRVRRADLQAYLARGLEVIIIPARNATPRAGTSAGGAPVTVDYLKRVPCKGYVGPSTAGKITPARFALGIDEPPGQTARSVSTRLEDVAC